MNVPLGTAQPGTSVPADTAFDHYHPDQARDPFDLFTRLRTTCPVARSDRHGGFWVVTSYDDIQQVARQPEIYSSRNVAVPPGDHDIYSDIHRTIPINLDPPVHAEVKTPLTRFFHPARARALEPQVRARAVSAIDSFLPAGQCDASTDFTRLIPLFAMCRLLGLPAQDGPQLSDWVDTHVDFPSSSPEGMAAARGINEYFRRVIAQRRRSPGDDYVSFLLGPELAGVELTDDDIVGACHGVLVAGLDTVRLVAASGLLYLARNPAEQERLRADPARIALAREEFLRAFSPISIARVAMRDVELGGRSITAGDMVFLVFASGNRDEAAFPAADQIVLDREPNRHLAFGVGAHRCLGVSLARMEIAVLLEEFLARVPAFRLGEDPITWSTGQEWGPRRLPLRFD